MATLVHDRRARSKPDKGGSVGPVLRHGQQKPLKTGLSRQRRIEDRLVDRRIELSGEQLRMNVRPPAAAR
jgi:hypothetical protein